MNELLILPAALAVPNAMPTPFCVDDSDRLPVEALVGTESFARDADVGGMRRNGCARAKAMVAHTTTSLAGSVLVTGPAFRCRAVNGIPSQQVRGTVRAPS